MSVEKKFYTTKEVATIFAVSPMTIYRAFHSGEAAHLRPMCIGSTIRFSKAAVDAIVDGDA